MLQINSNSVEQTKAIAKNIADIFDIGDLIILDGSMGAGKTHFVQGILQAYDYQNKVISPTFNIANFYETDSVTVLHLDLYRLESIEEFDDLGIIEYFETSIVFMEWGKKIADNFDEYLLISIEHDENEDNMRQINFLAKGKKYEEKLKAISGELKIES